MRASFSLLGSLILVLGAATPSFAGDNELSIGPSTRALRSDSANAVTANSLGGGALAYARHLPLELPQLAVWGVATMGWGGADGTMFQVLDTEVDTTTYTLGARARYALHRHAIATARFDLGMARTALELRDMSGRSASDSGWGGVSSAAIGMDVFAVVSRRFSIGLRFELGYVTATAVELTPRASRPDEDVLRLPMSSASLGELDLGGRTFSMSVISQF